MKISWPFFERFCPCKAISWKHNIILYIEYYCIFRKLIDMDKNCLFLNFFLQIFVCGFWVTTEFNKKLF